MVQSLASPINLGLQSIRMIYNILLKKKKQNTAGRGDVEIQASTAKSYGENTIADPCCAYCSDSKFVSVKHETHRS